MTATRKKNWLLILPVLVLLLAFKPYSSQIRVFVIGDSTASAYSASTYPRMGWAQVLQGFFDLDSVRIFDKAISGRSSKSFYHEAAAWPAVKGLLEEGDYLFIQFGHNDSKPDTPRATDPFTTYQEYLTRYIDEARSLGVTPVLMTSIHRNSWQADTLNVKDTHGDYLVAMRQLADSLDVALVDMAYLTDSLYEALGYTYTTENLFLNLPPGLYPAYPNGNDDNTHLQETGAYELAKLVADDLAVATDSTLLPLQSGLLEVNKVRFAVELVGTGYVQGPRYFPVEVEKSLFARPVDGYEFQGWQVDGQTLSETAVYTFSLSAGDTAVRVALFGLPSSLPEELAGVQVVRATHDSALILRSDSPMKMLRLIDSAGRSVYSWQGEPVMETQVDVSAFPGGLYYLYVQRSENEGWTKLLLD